VKTNLSKIHTSDNTIDQNAIIDFHPEMPNVLMVNGFSGHGLQQAPAAGRAAAELIATNKFQTLDLDIFSFDRCCGKKPPVFELGIV
jgi:glycine/D-amino acid oxidase-like deaminating enzyme